MRLARKKPGPWLVSKRVKEFPPSIFEEILKEAQEGRDTISLGPGEPDFVTPKHIRDHTKKALDKGMTYYSPAQGRSELLEAVSEKVEKKNKIRAGPERIMVTNGSTEGIMMSLMCLLDAGEEVFVPDPGFLTYIPQAEMIDAFPFSYKLNEEQGFQIDMDFLRKYASKRTKALVLNTPSNPTGTVFSKKVLEEIADIAVEHNIIVLSDEAYEDLAYGKSKHVSMGSLNGMDDYVVSLYTFSKSHAMCGYRLGYAIVPDFMIEHMKRLHLYTTLTATTPSQESGVKALKGSQKHIETMKREYDRRRKLILKRVDEIDYLHIEVKPEGAFYVFPRIKTSMNSIEFSKFLLKEAKVLTVPGTEFGVEGEGFIRMSYATKYSLIEKAMDRLEKVSSKIK